MPLDVEPHGIDTIPLAARTRGWFDLFAMYAGVNICLPMIIVGGVLVPARSFGEAVLIGLLGNLAALAAIAGGVAAGRAVPPEALQPLVSLAATALAYTAVMRLVYPEQFRFNQVSR